MIYLELGVLPVRVAVFWGFQCTRSSEPATQWAAVSTSMPLIHVPVQDAAVPVDWFVEAVIKATALLGQCSVPLTGYLLSDCNRARRLAPLLPIGLRLPPLMSVLP